MARRGMVLNGQHATVRAVALFPLARNFSGDDGFNEIQKKYGIQAKHVRDSYELIPLTVFLSILEESARLAEDPVLGARLGSLITPGDLGPAGVLMAQSATLRRGLSRYAESISALQGVTDMRLTESDGQMDFTYQIRIEHAERWPQDAEMSLASTSNLIRTCFYPRWKPIEVHFVHGSAGRARLLEEIFRAPVRFGQSANRLIFSMDNVDTHVRTEDEALMAVVSRHIDDLILEGRQKSEDHVSLVKSIVARRLGRSPCSLAVVAAELGITQRTLQRYLSLQATSFREILQDCRKEVAAVHLAETSQSLSEVAWSMGYSDGTVLWRAYKKWTGVAPSRRRQPHPQGQEGG